MERHIALLQNNVDDNEQYSRCMCLRINGIPPVADGEIESAEMCIEKVKIVFEKLEVDVPDSVMGQAHRIGTQRTINGKKIHEVIARFTTRRHRTLVYKQGRRSKGTWGAFIPKKNY